MRTAVNERRLSLSQGTRGGLRAARGHRRCLWWDKQLSLGWVDVGSVYDCRCSLKLHVVLNTNKHTHTHMVDATPGDLSQGYTVQKLGVGVLGWGETSRDYITDAPPLRYPRPRHPLLSHKTPLTIPCTPKVKHTLAVCLS